MTDYLQPDFYRFNSDSLELVKWILSQVESTSSILDIGAGCGVIGFELARKLQPEKLVLLEGQEDFKSYLTHNLSFLPLNTKCEIKIELFSQWKPKDEFDLIVCNPPYYLPGRGEVSSDSRRGMARSFIRDDWRMLLMAIERSLSPKGQAFLVIKNQVEIEREIHSKLGQRNLVSRFEQRGDLTFLKLVRLDIN